MLGRAKNGRGRTMLGNAVAATRRTKLPHFLGSGAGSAEAGFCAGGATCQFGGQVQVQVQSIVEYAKTANISSSKVRPVAAS